MTTQTKALDLDAVYNTIIQWGEGGGKRSRRELAQQIVALAEQQNMRGACEAAMNDPQEHPLTDDQYFEIGQRHCLSSVKCYQIHKEIYEAIHGITG